MEEIDKTKDEIEDEKNGDFFEINNTINKSNKINENFLKKYKNESNYYKIKVDEIVKLLNKNGIFHPDLNEIIINYFENKKNDNDEENIKISNAIDSNSNEIQSKINEENNNDNNSENIVSFEEDKFYYFLLFIGTLNYEKKNKKKEKNNEKKI